MGLAWLQVCTQLFEHDSAVHSVISHSGLCKTQRGRLPLNMDRPVHI